MPTIRTIRSTSGACAAESDPLHSFRSLHAAYTACRRRKRSAINTLRFEASLLDNISDLGQSLAAGTYAPSRSICFVAKQPKHREVFAADFRDRVVHHALVPRIEAIFEPKFIHDSFACRRGKGTHEAVARLRTFMHQVTRGGRIPAWFMQLDIRSFFMSIDREILLGILDRHVRDPQVFALAQTIVRQDCTSNFIYKGDPRLLQRIPPHKSLFHIQPGKGLPIGNLTSQFFANVYLNELDQFVKHELKARCYLRYMDDFILLDAEPETLRTYGEKIIAYLDEHLALELKPGVILKRVSEGADFLGYIVRPEYSLVRKRVVGNLRSRLRQFERDMVQVRIWFVPAVRPSDGEKGRSGGGFRARGTPRSRRIFTHLHLRKKIVDELRQTLASYLGHFKHADSWRLVQGIWKRYSWLKYIFQVDAGRLVSLYEPSYEPTGLRAQYRWAAQRYGGVCIFFQLGCFCEFYGSQAQRYSPFFGLKSRAQGARITLSPKVRHPGESRGSVPGAAETDQIHAGFPIRYLSGFKKKATQAGLPYVVLGEDGYYPSGLKRRVVTEIFTVHPGCVGNPPATTMAGITASPERS